MLNVKKKFYSKLISYLGTGSENKNLSYHRK